MNAGCRCSFCMDPRLDYTKVSSEVLLDVAGTTDDRHKLARVCAFIELMYREGVFAPTMPFIVWRQVMGPGVPPPTSSTGFGAFWDRRGRSHWASPDDMH